MPDITNAPMAEWTETLTATFQNLVESLAQKSEGSFHYVAYLDRIAQIHRTLCWLMTPVLSTYA